MLRKSLLLLVAVALVLAISPRPAHAATYSLISHSTVTSSVNADLVSLTLNTTGANLLTACAVDTTFATASTLTDSLGNTWSTMFTAVSSHNIRVRILYVYNPSVGAAQQFNLAQTGSFPGLGVAAWSGASTSPADQQNEAESHATTNTTGSVTPGQNAELVFACNGHTSVHVSVSAPFTLLDTSNYGGGGSNYAITTSYVIQTVAAAANCTFTVNSTVDMQSGIGTFKVAVGSGSNLPAIFEYFRQMRNKQ